MNGYFSQSLELELVIPQTQPVRKGSLKGGLPCPTPFVLTIEPTTCLYLYLELNKKKNGVCILNIYYNLMLTHAFVVSILDHMACYIPLKYKCVVEKSEFVRPHTLHFFDWISNKQ